MKNLYLIGMPGCGKSFWGEAISRKYALPFFDLDAEIARRQGRSIERIFKEDGVAGFREIESAALHELILSHAAPLVLSCGGGTPVDPANLKLLRKTGYLVYLKAAIETLLRQLTGSQIRPLLTGGSLQDQLQTLYDQRRLIYEHAHVALDVEALSLKEFDSILQECTKPH